MKRSNINIKPLPLIFIFFIFFIGFTSCDQAALLWTIAKEVAPKEPLIDGALTKIVEQGDSLFLASGDLWEFTVPQGTAGKWDRIAKPNGTIRDIALTDTEDIKYVLTIDNISGATTIWKSTDSGGWHELASAGNLGYQAIFCANDKLFASLWNGKTTSDMTTNYTLSLLDGGDEWHVPNFPLVNGVVYASGRYYFATEGWGIRTTTDALSTTVDILPGTANYILGIIKINDTHVVAVSRGSTTPDKYADLYQIDAATNTVMAGYPIARTIIYTGALAIWTKTNSEGVDEKVLLVGVDLINNSDYGYHEIRITTDGILRDELNKPGNGQSPSSVDGDKDRYISTIEKHPVHSLMQAPGDLKNQNGFPVVFATTHKDGLWSYRDNAEVKGPVWNAEE
ncbi:MAG: hypothetical protein LBT01_04420 [Spirochaetaceae bacterium]|jgi:hypothetical protein|nr:hypothetical protein [Spirochaetaceae bacterium]